MVQATGFSLVVFVPNVARVDRQLNIISIKKKSRMRTIKMCERVCLCGIENLIRLNFIVVDNVDT